jgi:hypothetical protein
MTLSRDERAARAQQAKAQRREIRRNVDVKRPWLFPLIVGIAVVVLVGAVVAAMLLGVSF